MLDSTGDQAKPKLKKEAGDLGEAGIQGHVERKRTWVFKRR